MTARTPVVVEPLGKPAPVATRVRDAIHLVQFDIFPNRLTLPYPHDEIFSGYEEDALSIRDGYTGMGEGGSSFYLETQLGLCKLGWNPGPRRGKEGAIEKHIAEKWHIIALQEAKEYLEHEYLTSHFYVTQLWWLCCPVQQGHFSLKHQGYLHLPP